MPITDSNRFDTIAPGLIAELIAKDGLSEVEAANATEDYRRFLSLVRNDRPTCPPSLADTAWHRHMEMETYADDTRALCGRALNHDKNAFGTPEFIAAWADTRQRWLVAFQQDLGADPMAKDTHRYSSTGCFELP